MNEYTIYCALGSREVFPYGFKLTSPFLSSKVSQDTFDKLHAMADELKKSTIIVIPQTDMDKRDGTAKITTLTEDLIPKLELDHVVKLLKEGRTNEIPQIDALLIDKSLLSDVMVVSFSQVAPIISANSDDTVLLGTFLRDCLTQDTFNKIKGGKKNWHFEICLSTNFPYPNGSIPEQIERLIGPDSTISEFTEFTDPNQNEHLFSYGENHPDFGLLNNLVVLWCA